jgi:hypothetical protein|eukprot:g6082.t1
MASLAADEGGDLQVKGATEEEVKCVLAIKQKLSEDMRADPKCNDMAILRFARARDLDPDEAILMIEKWRLWRLEAEIDSITEETVKNEIGSGKAYFHGFDRKGRACLIVRPRLHDPNKRDINEVMRFGVYMLEKGIQLSETKGESDQICVLYDRNGFEYKNFDRQLFGAGRNLLSMLQDNYAERLGVFYVLGANWLYWMLFKIISVFLTQRSRDKIILIYSMEEMAKHFEQEELELEYRLPVVPKTDDEADK